MPTAEIREDRPHVRSELALIATVHCIDEVRGMGLKEKNANCE